MEPENLTPSGNLTAPKADSQDEPTIKEPCFMLTENRPLDYRASTTAPVGIQRKRTKGWKMPPSTKSVCRPGKWGNPYLITEDRDARDVCIAYETSLVCRLAKDKNGTPLIDQIGELRGYNLACFCPIGQPCHRDVLLRLSNAAIASVWGAS